MKINLYYTYILSNTNHKVLYIGMTNDLIRRVNEHKNKVIKGFTYKYNVDKLVYFEIFDFVELAISREKQLKAYSRTKKEALVSGFNSDWIDLYSNGTIKNPRVPNYKKSNLLFE
jgi:putative endonuclease